MGLGEGDKRSLFNGYKVSLLQGEKILETYCRTMLTVLNYTLRNGYDGKFYVVFFSTIKKISV